MDILKCLGKVRPICTDEDMLRIMSNENVETEEAKTAYQIDTCVAVGKFLKSHTKVAIQCYVNYMREHEEEAKHRNFSVPNGGTLWSPGKDWKPNNCFGISDFLGSCNWSKSVVIDLLKIHRDLQPEIKDQLQNYASGGRWKSKGMAKNTGVELARLGQDSPYQKHPVIPQLN